MNAESESLHERSESSGRSTSDTVAGFLSSIAIFMSVIGIAWHPLRLIIPSLAIALIASGMGSGKSRLPFVAVIICGVCFFLGMTAAVATGSPLW